MNQLCIGFIPPVIGTENLFNTFRMGKRYSKELSPGDVVLLLDEKKKIVFGKAEVIEVDCGPLMEMCVIYGDQNHSELHRDANYAAASLYRTLTRIYGPRIVTPIKAATVVTLRRIE